MLNFDIETLIQLEGFLEVEVMRLSNVPSVKQLLVRVAALLKAKEFGEVKRVEEMAV